MWQAGATLHRGARASHYRGLSCCGAQAPDAQAQYLWLTGLVAPRHVGSSQTGARTRVPCIGRQILNHCATREALKCRFLYPTFYMTFQTEVLILSLATYYFVTFPDAANDDSILPAAQAQKFGSNLKSSFSFTPHMRSTSQICQLYLQIYPESDLFSPSLPLPSWTKSPSSLTLSQEPPTCPPASILAPTEFPLNTAKSFF